MKKRNPWIGALWATAVLLIVVAFAAGVWQSSFFYQSTDVQPSGPVEEFIYQLSDATRYPAIVVGFATIGGLLFLHARNHARNHARGGFSQG